MRTTRIILGCSFLVAVSLGLYFSLRSPFLVKTGKLGDAEFMVAMPREWDGEKLLMIAHGLVPEGSPLNGIFDVSASGYGTMLEDGWLVAKTSYRRNGVIIEDGILDILELLDFISVEIGDAHVKIIEGSSMGGLIGVLMVEADYCDFDGAYVIGPAIYLGIDGFWRELTERPKRPLLLLANQSEYNRPSRYARQVWAKGGEVALWRVSRNGHVNINSVERKAALDAVYQWVNGETIDFEKDATFDMSPEFSAAVVENGALKVPVRYVNRSYGNLGLDLIESDLSEAGIEYRSHFQVSYGGLQFEGFYGDSFADVEPGEWVMFKTADGNYLLSQNGANAAESLGGVKKRDVLTIWAL